MLPFFQLSNWSSNVQHPMSGVHLPNSSILDQLGNDSMSSIRSAQRIGYSSNSRLSEYVWNVTY